MSVLNCYSVKPLDSAAVLAQAERTGALVSAEDHSVIGGLGGAIAECLARNCPVPLESVGVQDSFGESGDQDELYEKYGLTPRHIVEAVKKTVARKRERSR